MPARSPQHRIYVDLDSWRSLANNDLLAFGREFHVFERGGWEVVRVTQNSGCHSTESCGQAEVFWILMSEAYQEFRTFRIREVLNMMQASRVNVKHLARRDSESRELRVTVAYGDDRVTRDAICKFDSVCMPGRTFQHPFKY
jgi:hypothetical protein